jgi:hypothetical protein
MSMRDDIIEAVNHMTGCERADLQDMFDLPDFDPQTVLQYALDDEDIAEYVLHF